MKLIPSRDFVSYHNHLLKGHIKISHSFDNYNTIIPDGFKPFLKIVNTDGSRKARALLKVTFRVAKLSIFQRKFLPILSMPFFAGAPGFISKIFFINNETRAFCGLYEWENEEFVQNYIQSYPGDFMKRNALPNSLTFVITQK